MSVVNNSSRKESTKRGYEYLMNDIEREYGRITLEDITYDWVLHWRTKMQQDTSQDIGSLANALGVWNNTIGTFIGKISGTSTDPITVCQEVVSAITTGGKHIVVNCLHDLDGIRFVHGYLYSTKDYGYFTITFYGSNNRTEVKLLNNTYTVISN